MRPSEGRGCSALGSCRPGPGQKTATNKGGRHRWMAGTVDIPRSCHGCIADPCRRRRGQTAPGPPIKRRRRARPAILLVPCSAGRALLDRLRLPPPPPPLSSSCCCWPSVAVPGRARPASEIQGPSPTQVSKRILPRRRPPRTTARTTVHAACIVAPSTPPWPAPGPPLAHGLRTVDSPTRLRRRRRVANLRRRSCASVSKHRQSSTKLSHGLIQNDCSRALPTSNRSLPSRLSPANEGPCAPGPGPADRGLSFAGVVDMDRVLLLPMAASPVAARELSSMKWCLGRTSVVGLLPPILDPPTQSSTMVRPGRRPGRDGESAPAQPDPQP